jgi:hypothetical protein
VTNAVSHESRLRPIACIAHYIPPPPQSESASLTNELILRAENPEDVLRVFRDAVNSYGPNPRRCPTTLVSRNIYHSLDPEAQEAVLAAYENQRDRSHPENDPILLDYHPLNYTWNSLYYCLQANLRDPCVDEIGQQAGNISKRLQSLVPMHYTPLDVLRISLTQLEPRLWRALAQAVIAANRKGVDIGIPPESREEALGIAAKVAHPTDPDSIIPNAAADIHKLALWYPDAEAQKVVATAQQILNDAASKARCDPRDVAATISQLYGPYSGVRWAERLDEHAWAAGIDLGFSTGTPIQTTREPPQAPSETHPEESAETGGQ